MSVWKKRPHQAKFFAREHFGKLYDEIFDDELTGAELVVATLIYRIAENKRKRPDAEAPQFLPYASCFLAMRMGEYLSRDLGLTERLNHRGFDDARRLVGERGESYYYDALKDITNAISRLYGSADQTLARLVATFRRGDLIDELALVPLQQPGAAETS